MTQDPHAPTRRSAHFRFYQELNDFLPRTRRGVGFCHHFIGRPSVKSVLEGLGVPQAEIDLILVDGRSVGFDHRLVGGERVAVYPMFEALDIQPLNRLRPEPLRHPKFIVDVNLGKLASLLRLCGLDSRYSRDFEDGEIVRLAAEERRIILTRDKGILHYRTVTHGYWVRNTEPQRQLLEVIDHLQLQGRLCPFSRCIRCNGLLSPAERQQVRGQVPPGAWREHRHFFRCEGCRQVYWRGSHYRRMAARLAAEGLLGDQSEGATASPEH